MKISTNILKCVDNKRFVSRNDEDFVELTYGVKRIWFSDKLDIVPDKNDVYELTTKGGRKIEGNILQVGEDDFGFYIIFRRLMWKLIGKELSLKEKRIGKGAASIRLVFTPGIIKGNKEVISQFRGFWPVFYRTFMSFERKDNNIKFEFKEGALGDAAVKLNLIDVVSESYEGEECRNLEYFKDGRINELDIRILENGKLKVIINNNYTEYIHEGYDAAKDPLSERIIEVGEEAIPGFNEPSDDIIIEHHNEGIIECGNMEVSIFNFSEKTMDDKDIRCIRLFSEDLDTFSEAENLRKRWLESFAKDVDTTDIFIDNFLWHLFSYERVKAVEGDEAKDKLKAIPKKSLYIFLNDRDIAYRLENAEKFSVEDIRFYQDVYVVDEDFTWTYVSTHENGLCGPYFYNRKANNYNL